MYNDDEQFDKNTSSIRQTSDALLDAYANNKLHQKDVDTIKNRKGVNEAKPRVDDEDTISDNSSLGKKSSLEEKEGLEKKDTLSKDEKPSLDSKTHNKDIASGLKDKVEDVSGIAKLKKKWIILKLEIKIAIIVAAIALAFFIFVLFFMTIASAVDTFTSAITNFFGISEATVREGNNTYRTGLYTTDAYKFDENGDPLNNEELIYKLRDDGDGCKVNILTRIGDFLAGQDVKTRCQFMRYIKRAAESKNIDRSLIIGSILYGYDTQAMPSEYFDEKDVPKSFISASDHYEVLDRILSNPDAPITKKMLDKIIDNSVAIETRFYYTWSIKETKNEDGEITSKTGVCTKTEIKINKYDLDKWKIFMRFGEDVAAAYQEYNLVTFAYESSSEECNGSMTEEQLLQRVINSNSSGDPLASDVKYSVNVKEAVNALKNYQSNYSDLFYQHADVDSKELDVFESYKGIEFDYANGFAYQNFPGYGRAMNDNLTSIKYDKVYTPKDIEQLIEDIIQKKRYMNEVLLETDPDNPVTDIFGNGDSLIDGAYCSQYLTVPLDQITVRLTDCYGKDIGKVSFEDYIIGVANAEVSNSNDNYVLSEMLAAISYALNRRNNYAKGNEIWMKSGTCDQAYCSPIQGCKMVNNPDVCSGCASFYIGGSRGKSPDIYAKYRLLYQTAAQYLIISNGKVHNAHYVSTIQNQWRAKALSGMYFTQIIQETYEDEDAEVIKCTDGTSSDTSQEEVEQPKQSTEKYGDIANYDYPKKAPDKGSYYGFSYANTETKAIIINPAWKEYNLTTIKPSCSNNEFATMSFTVHTKAASKFQKAFDGICKMLTTGVTVNGKTCKYTMSDLQGGTAFLETKTELGDLDLHPYGLAQSWNYSKTYNINGKTYRPYSPTSGAEEYWDFVNALGGKEEDCRNVNYVLWLKAYKDAGFNWGGNNGRKGNNGSFRGNLFEIKY